MDANRYLTLSFPFHLSPFYHLLPSSIARVIRLLTRCTENVATDLESFCNHAGRTTVTTDDVLLLARKNPDLHQIMKEFVDRRRAEKEAVKGRRK